MLWLLFSLVLSMTVGYLITVSILWTSSPNMFDRMLRWSLASGIGLGLSSCFYFIDLLIFTPSGDGLLVFDASIHLILIICLAFMHNRVSAKPSEHPPIAGFSSEPIFYYLYWGGMLISILTFILMSLQSPYGGDDTLGIWNIRARVMVYAQTPWLQDLTTIGAHPDYPLLLPSLVARSWAYYGDCAWWIPHLINAIITYSTIVCITGIVAHLSGGHMGFLAGWILIGTPFFIREGAGQQADVFMAYYILSSLSLLALRTCKFPNRIYLEFAAGLMAGLAAWTKNEGILFLVVLFAVYPISVAFQSGPKIGMRSLSALFIGVLPVLSLLVYFKIQIAPVNDLVAGQDSLLTIARLLDWKRYQAILVAFSSEMLSVNRWQIYPVLLVLYLGKSGINRSHAHRFLGVTLFVVVCLLLIGYFCVYLTTPHDLAWHLRTSLHRLLLQVWPATLLIASVLVRNRRQQNSSSSLANDIEAF